MYTESEVITIFTQICLGLKHCHDRKIMHRDIKPLNILLTQNGEFKLADFGISKVLRRTESLAHTQAGTLYHMSPEIWKGKPYNMKSDIWSLGTLLYQLITFKMPFAPRGNSRSKEYDLMTAILYHPCP